ncbi:hypothetical protein SASPL_111080 [Salvia splendens]|uniref:Uncharacterized protein n=1 Tax=Salvia splendens TaxID=180675 RepID=A0A8X8YB87_SALSN|nr:uncharacterized protein LOC121800650 [Salvia splendens]KAG6426845.1 hypothetical protein SASPL_111080 [Salvia splendens]
MPPASFPLVVILILSAAFLAAPTSETVYDILRYYRFPPGLVPRGVVTRFRLNSNTGQFALYLNKTCSFTAYGYDVRFQTQIRGVIRDEEIEGLRGVQVRMMNFWSDLVEVEVVEDGEEVEFSNGFAAVDMPVYNFFNIPMCGCGFDCRRSFAGT